MSISNFIQSVPPLSPSSRLKISWYSASNSSKWGEFSWEFEVFPCLFFLHSIRLNESLFISKTYHSGTTLLDSTRDSAICKEGFSESNGSKNTVPRTHYVCTNTVADELTGTYVYSFD